MTPNRAAAECWRGRGHWWQDTLGLQFKLDASGGRWVPECNPRGQGTLVASIFCGANVIGMGVPKLLGDPREGPPTAGLKPASFLRTSGGLGILGDEVHEN
jgi:ATP-grasp in the biosynthetic pathway with Ter operon